MLLRSASVHVLHGYLQASACVSTTQYSLHDSVIVDSKSCLLLYNKSVIEALNIALTYKHVSVHVYTYVYA